MSLTTMEHFIDNAVIDEEVLVLDNNKIYIRSFNPHGFYRISLDKGRLPESLKGSYTNRRSAELDARRYYTAEKNRPVTVAKE